MTQNVREQDLSDPRMATPPLLGLDLREKFQRALEASGRPISTPPLEKAVEQSFVSAQEIDRFVGFVTVLGRAQRLR